MKTLIILAFIIFFKILILPQNTVYLRGQVIYIQENNFEEPQSGTTVLIAETGDRDKTDKNGVFKIFLNQKFNPGDNITLAIEKEGWAIRDPLFGKTYVPSDLQKDLIKLSLLPKGSPLFFTDQQIKKYIEYLILKQTTVKAISNVDYSKLTLEALLDTMAISWGFGVSEIKSTVMKWIEKALEDTNKFYERGLAEYASKNFGIAGELFKKSANLRIEKFRIIDEDFKKLSKERQSIVEETIRDLRLAGESYFEVKQYDSSMVAYKNAIAFLNYAEDWEILASTLNSVATCYYYLSLKTYDESKLQYLDSANKYLYEGSTLSMNKSLDDWRWKFEGNLAILTAHKEIYSLNNNKPKELYKAINNLRLAHDNGLNANDSKDKFLIKNNLGICYNYLYQFTEDLNKAIVYLDTSEAYFTSITIDSTIRLEYPVEWAYIFYNSALTSIEIGFTKYPVPSFFQMLALRTCDSNSVCSENSNYQEIDTSYIKSLFEVYLKFLEVEKIINKKNKSFELVSILNSIARLRIQLMIYSNNYLNHNFIQVTDSLISISDSLAYKDGFFRETMFATGNKACLEILSLLCNKKHSIQRLIHLNNKIENLLAQGNILKLYETYLKKILMLNNFLLSKLFNDESQRNDFLNKALLLNDEVIKNYEDLGYFREYEEGVRIQEIITNSN